MRYKTTNWDYVSEERTAGRTVKNFEALNQNAAIAELDGDDNIPVGSSALRAAAGGYELYDKLEDGWVRTV
jgi:hypothetical protein